MLRTIIHSVRRCRKTHFQVLGIEPTFQVDMTELTRALKEQQLRAHPDVGGTQDLSAALNEAARVLRNPHLRAEYWLKVKGGAELREEERVKPALAMEIMDIAEQIEEANCKERAQLTEAVDDKITALLESFRFAAQEEDWTTAQQCLEELKLYIRLQESFS
eukprot:GEMP01089191.1.p1 GENE.GEMP01089191.1~~GEMP01089191.1.p1  ORF type:complete len:162 (+),score=42.58 GEMP01089191.1:130-615(+)